MKRPDFQMKEHYTIQDLLTIMAVLRSDDGCVWDREQDHHSIRNNLIEETYEAVEAIDREDRDLLLEELGDVLMQVVFHAQMEAEQGHFTFDDVCDGVCQKLIYRHPHVFGDVTVENSVQVLDNWDKLKQVEKHQETLASRLGGVSAALPGLMRAAKVQKRAAGAGFCYDDVQGAIRDLKSEIAELEAALENRDAPNIAEEVGDILFSAVNVSRMAGADPEEALYRSTDKFVARVSAVEALAMENGTPLSAYTSDQLDNLWRRVKE